MASSKDPLLWQAGEGGWKARSAKVSNNTHHPVSGWRYGQVHHVYPGKKNFGHPKLGMFWKNPARGAELVLYQV